MFVRLAHLAGVNAALVLAGLALVAIAGEAYLRLTSSFFLEPVSSSRFVPGVGVLYEPHTDVRIDGPDYRTVTRANGLGFLDREPPDPARAAASCHVAVFGDSFVEAREVRIADKLHVRLEALAAAATPELDVTAQAWGRKGTGQANQLPFHDEYARPLRPDLLVLVFVRNDFLDNSPAMAALQLGWDPDRTPYAFPERAADGGLRLRPPDPDYAASALPWFRSAPQPGGPWYEDIAEAAAGRSLFLRWLDGKLRALTGDGTAALEPGRAELLAARPGYEWILDGWEPPRDSLPLYDRLFADASAPVFAEAFEFTAWALAEFKRRADRDGAAIVVLSVHENTRGGRTSVALQGMADSLGIPVINQRDWIASRGGYPADASWPYDRHWTPKGHQWAAEALFDWLRRHPEVCDDRARA